MQEAVEDYLATFKKDDTGAQETTEYDEPSRKDRSMTLSPRRRGFREYYGTFSASPLILFILGGAALFFAVIAMVVEIRTSELLVLGGKTTELPWGVFLQPYDWLLELNPCLPSWHGSMDGASR